MTAEAHPDDLSDMLWWHVLLRRLHIAEFPLVSISLGVQLLPLPCLHAVMTMRHGVHRKWSTGYKIANKVYITAELRCSLQVAATTLSSQNAMHALQHVYIVLVSVCASSVLISRAILW